MTEATKLDQAPTVEEIRTHLSEPMTTLEQDEVERYRNRAAQAEERLSWAPVIGNGAAIVALAGIVGNVDSPDTALAALTWPLTIFSAGLALSLAAVYLNADLLSLVGDAQKTSNRIRRELLLLLNEGMALKEGVTPANRAERVAMAETVASRATPLDRQYKQLSRRLNMARFRTAVAAAFNAAAVGTVAIGFAVLLIGHAAGGFRLERAQQGGIVQPVGAR